MQNPRVAQQPWPLQPSPRLCSPLASSTTTAQLVSRQIRSIAVAQETDPAWRNACRCSHPRLPSKTKSPRFPGAFSTGATGVCPTLPPHRGPASAHLVVRAVEYFTRKERRTRRKRLLDSSDTSRSTTPTVSFAPSPGCAGRHGSRGCPHREEKQALPSTRPRRRKGAGVAGRSRRRWSRPKGQRALLGWRFCSRRRCSCS